jgi:hypothetical protein
MGSLLLIGALALLLVAATVGTVVALGDHRPIIVGPRSEFAWLTADMNGCEAEAKMDPGSLYFLVIPLTAAEEDDTAWSAKSIMNVGNAILLRSGDALDGLKSGMLVLYDGRYDFRIRDEASGTVHTWKPYVGVAKMSTDAAAPSLFKVQIQTPGSGSDLAWGSEFTRQAGTCYWVNAIVRNDAKR